MVEVPKKMHKQLLCLVSMISATCCYAELVEWPITLHHEIQSPAGHTDEVTNGIGSLPPVDPPFHAAGYLELNNTINANLFYFYFQERTKNPDAPLLLWINGGPGMSSMFGLFMENGPYIIQSNLSLNYREYGWDVGQNAIFLDQPVGTGFSKTNHEQDLADDEDEVGQDVLMFLLEFMELHPELRTKEIYLSGQAYAGHFLLAIANATNQSNKEGKLMHLNLAGVLMGNPVISPIGLMLSYPYFAFKHNLISEETAAWLYKHADTCKAKSTECNTLRTKMACLWGYYYCYGHFLGPVEDDNPQVNPFDIRKECLVEGCYDTRLLVRYLNSHKVKLQLGVHKKWEELSVKVSNQLGGDLLIDMTPTFISLLNEGLRFLIYAGDQDLTANWIGTKVLVDGLTWNKSDEWKGELKTWAIDTKTNGTQEVGECETVESLTFCRIYEAGLMVPMDQPEVAHAAVRNFIEGTAFVKPDPTAALTRAGQAVKASLVAT